MTHASGWIIGAILAAGLWAPAGWSDEPAPAAPSSTDHVESYVEQAQTWPPLEKLGRGVSNIAGGWLEIPLNIGKRYDLHDTGTSLAVGAIAGLFKGVVRTGVGVYETLTFFIPLPRDFAPILPTLEYFQKTPHHAPLLLE